LFVFGDVAFVSGFNSGLDLVLYFGDRFVWDCGAENHYAMERE
jgi:hypothetical protein